MEAAIRDLRFALRQLRRNVGFTVVAVMTLGLGIGAATSIFNAPEVALHRPLPFEHEDRLTRIYRVPGAGTPRISLRPATFQAVERSGRFFERIVGQRYITTCLALRCRRTFRTHARLTTADHAVRAR